MAWIRVKDGIIPEGAVVAGRENSEHGNAPLYIIRANYEGGIHIGKARGDWREGLIPYGGKEIKVTEFEVFVPDEDSYKWVKVTNAVIPDGAVVGGRESAKYNFAPLFIARANYLGGIVIGKTRGDWDQALCPYGGQEVKIAPYEVLVYKF